MEIVNFASGAITCLKWSPAKDVTSDTPMRLDQSGSVNYSAILLAATTTGHVTLLLHSYTLNLDLHGVVLPLTDFFDPIFVILTTILGKA